MMSTWPFWLDDFLIGGFLLYAYWRTRNREPRDRRFLAAAWGFACGMAYPSFLGQIASLDVVDPAPIPTEWVAVIKGVGLALSVLALVGSLGESEDRNAQLDSRQN